MCQMQFRPNHRQIVHVHCSNGVHCGDLYEHQKIPKNHDTTTNRDSSKSDQRYSFRDQFVGVVWANLQQSSHDIAPRSISQRIPTHDGLFGHSERQPVSNSWVGVLDRYQFRIVFCHVVHGALVDLFGRVGMVLHQ